MKSSGFTLIEIIVSVTVLSIFLVMAVSTTTIMVQNMRANERRILATYYADDLMNWLKFEKESSWSAVLSKASAAGQTYCANKATVKIDPTTGQVQTFETVNTLLTTSTCAWDGIINPVDTNPKVFKRQIMLKSRPPNNDQIDVQITVQWQDLGKTYKVESSAPFYFIE